MLYQWTDFYARTLYVTQMIIRGKDGGGGILDDKARLRPLNWRIGSEDGGGGDEGGIHDLHPITLMAGQISCNLLG